MASVLVFLFHLSPLSLPSMLSAELVFMLIICFAGDENGNCMCSVVYIYIYQRGRHTEMDLKVYGTVNYGT